MEDQYVLSYFAVSCYAKEIHGYSRATIPSSCACLHVTTCTCIQIKRCWWRKHACRMLRFTVAMTILVYGPSLWNCRVKRLGDVHRVVGKLWLVTLGIRQLIYVLLFLETGNWDRGTLEIWERGNRGRKNGMMWKVGRKWVKKYWAKVS